MTPRPMRLTQGFTLFELLVAMSIFAVVSYMAYSGLRNIMDARSQTDQISDRLGELQIAFTRIGNDLQQAVPRPIRGEYGDDRKAFIAAELGELRLEFTRTGRRNPSRTPRSILQRVAYSISDHVLYRLTWSMLDRPQDAKPQRSAVLTDVNQLEMRYLDGSNQWSTSWPPVQLQNSLAVLPKAVEVRLQTEDFGTINRFFIVAGD